ncbi:MarR family transcriptional regulator [Paenibacillus alvei]|nr:MarR family transcriptional regulator [Paenibacillus alvei]NEZ44074.1 MarR family transcriptional regulator [Paenibacillus alvei]
MDKGVLEVDHNSALKHQVHELYTQFLHQQQLQEKLEGEAFLEEIRESVSEHYNFHLTEIHVLSCIGHTEPINLTAIAEKMGISKGNISKINSRLLKEGWIRKSQLNDNKKEIYFRLTPMGKKVFSLHEQYHDRAHQLFNRFISRYSTEQLEFMKQLLQDGITAIQEGQLLVTAPELK